MTTLVITTARTEFDLNINADFWVDLNEDGIDSGRFRHLRMAPMKLGDVGKLASLCISTYHRQLWNQRKHSILHYCQKNVSKLAFIFHIKEQLWIKKNIQFYIFYCKLIMMILLPEILQNNVSGCISFVQADDNKSGRINLHLK